MNWVVLYLPLVVSISFLLATAGLYFSLKNTLTGVEVPIVKREEPDLSKIRAAFSRVFPELRQPQKATTKVHTAPKDIELLGTSVGSKSMVLLKVGKKTVVLEEGQTKEGITLIGVSRKSALVRIGKREVELRVKPRKVGTSAPARTKTVGSGEAEFRISKRELERITKDPGIMFRQIRLVPYVKDGKTEGFIFEWVKPGSLFYRAGLRKGDVLLSINNMTIQSGEDAFRLLQVLRNEPSLKVVVMRNGQRREINIRIE